MPVELKKPKELVKAGLARWGYYGDNGTGKSTLLASTEGPGLVVNTSNEGIDPYLVRDDIRIATVTRWDDLMDLFITIKQGLNDPRVVSGERTFVKWIGFDTYTRIQGLALKKVKKIDQLSAEEELKLLTTAQRENAEGWGQWEAIGNLANNGMVTFNQLPIHVIYLWQEQHREPKFEGASPAETLPAGTPYHIRYAKEVCTLLGRMFTLDSDGGKDILAKKGESWKIDPNRKVDRYILIDKHERYFAKGPSHVLGYVVRNPSWKKLAAGLVPTPVNLDEE